VFGSFVNLVIRSCAVKLKVRRVAAGPAGYELYDADAGDKVIKTGVTTDQIYQVMIVPQVQVAIAGIGKALLEADASFAAAHAGKDEPVVATPAEAPQTAKQKESFPDVTRPGGEPPITEFPPLKL
jgi:hypothetical protein